MVEYFINPRTNKRIKKGGPTYNALIKKGTALKKATPKKAISKKTPKKATRHVGRGGLTKGWRSAAPKKGAERAALRRNCGSGCYLLPELLKFPVCARCRGEVCSCRPDCRGIRSAEIRAKQRGYTEVAKKAIALKKKYNC